MMHTLLIKDILKYYITVSFFYLKRRGEIINHHNILFSLNAGDIKS
jgi:hypothetical protein